MSVKKKSLVGWISKFDFELFKLGSMPIISLDEDRYNGFTIKVRITINKLRGSK